MLQTAYRQPFFEDIYSFTTPIVFVSFVLLMKKIFLVLLFFVSMPLFASHIVGGEFELLHISGYSYQLNLIYYFDEINGDQGNKTQDTIVHVKIFRYYDGALMQNVDIPWTSETPVEYTQPACANNGFVKTSKQYYTTIITLSPTRYNHPQGYYVVWERCCRNYSIINIVSQNTQGIQDAPNAAGQTFYLKFPPVVESDGITPFVNSSPRLFPPLSDFGCPGRPYYKNFAGTDDDNDSLVYSLVTPLDTQDHNSYPNIGPAPYPDVRWLAPYSFENIMGGKPDLKISKDGLITVTPKYQGLFVFAVKVEEYRNDIKIGETRRDFQMLVVDGCQPDQAPQIVGKKLTDLTFSDANTMSVSYASTVSNSDRCVVVRVGDPDTDNPLYGYTQNITIKAVALNFNKADLTSILPSVTTATLTHTDSVSEFQICFPQCPYINGPYQIGIVAYDDACSLPMTDTLIVTVNEQGPPAAEKPYFLPLKITNGQLNEGSSGSWPFTATTTDPNQLSLSVITDGFALSNVGMNLNITNQQPGSVSGNLSWDAFCKIYDIVKRTDFTVEVLASDENICHVKSYDTAIFNLKVILPNINPAVNIYTEDDSKLLTDSTVVENLGHIGLDVIGTDINKSTIDTLNLSLLSITGTTMQDYTFSPATGLYTVNSKFSWDPTCSIFKDGSYDNNYTLTFLVENNYCKTPITDTAQIHLEIKDIESTDKNFLPANVITANGDNCNDFFAIDGFEGEPECNHQPRQIPEVPLDNCTNKFEHVWIYDRWGRQVFESTDRYFRWYATNESDGVYYYLISFTKGKYKSAITVIH